MAEKIPTKSSKDDELDSRTTLTDSGDQFVMDAKTSDADESTKLSTSMSSLLIVTFNKTKMLYTMSDKLYAHFSVFLSSYKMNDNDRIGICRLPDDTFIISKLISECEVDDELENLDDIGLLDDDRIIAKKVCFDQKDLPIDMKKSIYFQFCYQNTQGAILGKSTPFQIKDQSDDDKNLNKNPSMIESTATTSGIERPDEEDFIVVRSQESFLKERIEHLTKSNNLLQYLIRNMEKDLVDKENENKELNSRIAIIENELKQVKKAQTDSAEMLDHISHEKENLDYAKSQLEETVRTERELRRRLEKELSELQLTYKEYDKDLKDTRENGEQLQAILLQKEEDLSLAQDLVDNLRKANTELLTKISSLEDNLETTKSTLAKTMDERRSLLAERTNWQTTMQSNDENKIYLIHRIEELERMNEKQKNEIKSLENELRQSMFNLKNLNDKYEKEQSITEKQKQDMIIKNDKLNADYIEMRARLEQAKIEYGNLYQKYAKLQNENDKKTMQDKPSETIYPKLPTTSNVSASLSSLSSTSKTNDNIEIIDPIDLILNELEKEAEMEKPLINEAPIAASSAAPQQQQQCQTSVKTLATAEPSAPEMEPQQQQPEQLQSPKQENYKIIKMPCTMCDQTIHCRQKSNDESMEEMIEHFEQVHKQKICPYCSVLFDTRLSIFKSYYQTHLQNHINQMKYPTPLSLLKKTI